MRKKYIKPIFVAEAYVFSASIAKCDIDIDTTKPLVFVKGETSACPGGDGGHVYGGQNGEKGSIVKYCQAHEISAETITLFNDGLDKFDCAFDWDGRTNIVAQTGDNFAVSLYGNEADVGGHSPSYSTSIFLS